MHTSCSCKNKKYPSSSGNNGHYPGNKHDHKSGPPHNRDSYEKDSNDNYANYGRSSVTCGEQSQVDFCVDANFQQELIPISGSNNQFQPSSVSNHDSRIVATLKLSFAPDLSYAKWKLYVFGATANNNRIIGAHLHAGSSKVNGPVIVNLYTGDPVRSNGLLSSGIIRNNNIMHVTDLDGNQFNTVASLYGGIKQSRVYVNVHSQLLPDGAARGQIYAKC